MRNKKMNNPCYDCILDSYDRQQCKGCPQKDKYEKYLENFKKCELLPFCPNKSVICNLELPDKSCYWYRYFKKLIEENKNEDK